VFGLTASAVTALFFNAPTGAPTASALPFERAGDGTAFFVGFLVLGAAMVVISVWKILKTVYIVCPVFYAAWWTRGELENCSQILLKRLGTNHTLLKKGPRIRLSGQRVGEISFPCALKHPFPHVSPHAAVRRNLHPLQKDRPIYSRCVSFEIQANGDA
jgi:hypothetical protein